MNPEASLIISVYNNVERLKLVLAGVSRQTYNNFEIIIADDGSGDKMKEFIDQYQKSAKISMKHLWQEDIGFRKNKILNEAVKAAAAEYLIFIDGDCIPHKYFIEAHTNRRAENTALCGSRVMLSERITNRLKTEDVLKGKVEDISFLLVMDAIAGKASRLEEGIFLPPGLFEQFRIRRRANLLGSNYSLSKSLLEKINGFDEDYVGAGLGEDSDIQYRLTLLGARFKSVRNHAIVYHLYHTKTSESSENMLRFHEKKKQQKMVCDNGLIKLSANI